MDDEKKPHHISLNTDVGEGFGAWRIADDYQLLEIVSDANVACGFHAGDPDIMRETCASAAHLGVDVGAQVGYPDLRGFGRRAIDVPAESLVNDLLYQLGAIQVMCNVEGVALSYIKLHGALYHGTLSRRDYQTALARVVNLFNPLLPIMCQPGTSMANYLTTNGCLLIREGYLDRAYQSDGLLVPRTEEGSMIVDPEIAGARAVQFAREGTVETIEGKIIPMPVDSLCLHSDSSGAIEMALAVRAALVAEGITIQALATSQLSSTRE